MEKDQHLEQLYHLSVAIGTTLDLEHETAAFMDWLTEAVGPSLAALFITDEAKQELRLMGAHGFEPPAEPRLPLGLDLWRWLAEQGASVPEEDDSHRYAVPIPIEQQLFGTLCLVSRRPADALPEEQRLVKTAAGYLAPVLRNIWRYQTLEQRVVERTAALRALNTVATAVSQSLDLKETLAAALDATLEATDFEVGGIALWDEKEQRLQQTITRGVEPELAAIMVGPLRAGGHRERLLRTGQPVFHDDTAHDPTVNPEIARYGFTISAMVPLMHKGRALGFLAVATRAPRRWTEEDKSLLTAVGRGIGVAVANARLYEETQRGEERYRSLVNTTNDLVFTVDVEGNILFANPAAKAFTGYEPEETIGHSFAEYVHPDDVPGLLAGIQQVLRGEPLESIRGVGRDAEYRMVRRDGQIIWVSTRGWPVRDAGGKIAGFSGIIHDITERKRAEEALKEYSERLEEMVEERTRELKDAQERLIRQERLATLGQLAGSVAHELRNPLAVINNIVYLLRLTLSDAPETVGEYLDLLSSEVRNAEAIIADLLSFSAVAPPEREPIAVFQLVASVLERQPPPEGVEVTTRVPPHLPPVYADPRQMRQVLTNLVANAYQAMPDGGRLTVEARVAKTSEVSGKLPKSEGVAISVADTGTGISPENMGKLFEPLFTTRARGIGLGLAISRRFVEANEGCIEVESEEGKGSTFTVYLPASSDQSMYEVKAGVEPLGGVPAEASTPLD